MLFDSLDQSSLEVAGNHFWFECQAEFCGLLIEQLEKIFVNSSQSTRKKSNHTGYNFKETNLTYMIKRVERELTMFVVHSMNSE